MGIKNKDLENDYTINTHKNAGVSDPSTFVYSATIDPGGGLEPITIVLKDNSDIGVVGAHYFRIRVFSRVTKQGGSNTSNPQEGELTWYRLNQNNWGIQWEPYEDRGPNTVGDTSISAANPYYGNITSAELVTAINNVSDGSIPIGLDRQAVPGKYIDIVSQAGINITQKIIAYGGDDHVLTDGGPFDQNIGLFSLGPDPALSLGKPGLNDEYKGPNYAIGNSGIKPFRFKTPGIYNLRGQTAKNHYKTFLGEQKV